MVLRPSFGSWAHSMGTTLKRTRVIAALVLLTVLPFACAHAPHVTSQTANDVPAGFRTEKAMNRAIRDGKLPRAQVDVNEVGRVVIIPGVQYAHDEERNVLDVYAPREMHGPAPVILFVHGGAWDHGDKQSCAPYAVHFAARGYLCASIEYRLAPGAPFPAAVDDVRAAMVWVRDHADKFGGDAGRIALVGQSAGAHLGMLAAYDTERAPLAPACVAELYGPVDLTTPAARRMKAVRRFLGATYRAAPELYRRASPVSYVSSTSPPTLLIHGTTDTLVSVRQAEALANALATSGVPHRFVRLEGWGHAMDRAAPAFAFCADELDRFFRRYLRPGHPEATGN